MEDFITRMTEEDFIRDESTESLIKVLTKVRRAYLAPTSLLPTDLQSSEFIKKLESVKMCGQSSVEVTTSRSSGEISRGQHQQQPAESSRGGCISRRSPMIGRSVERSVSLPPFLRPIEEETQSEGQTSRSETETEDDDVSNDETFYVTNNSTISTSQVFRSEIKQTTPKAGRTRSMDGALGAISKPSEASTIATTSVAASSAARTTTTTTVMRPISAMKDEVKASVVDIHSPNPHHAVITGRPALTKEQKDFETDKEVKTISCTIDEVYAAEGSVALHQSSPRATKFRSNTGNITINKCRGKESHLESKVAETPTSRTQVKVATTQRSSKSIIKSKILEAEANSNDVVGDVSGSEKVPEELKCNVKSKTFTDNFSSRDSFNSSSDVTIPYGSSTKTECDKANGSRNLKTESIQRNNSEEKVKEVILHESTTPSKLSAPIVTFQLETRHAASIDTENKLLQCIGSVNSTGQNLASVASSGCDVAPSHSSSNVCDREKVKSVNEDIKPTSKGGRPNTGFELSKNKNQSYTSSQASIKTTLPNTETRTVCRRSTNKNAVNIESFSQIKNQGKSSGASDDKIHYKNRSLCSEDIAPSVDSKDFNCRASHFSEHVGQPGGSNRFGTRDVIKEEECTDVSVSGEDVVKSSFSSRHILCLALVSSSTFIANFYRIPPSYLIALVFIMSSLCIKLSGNSSDDSKRSSSNSTVDSDETIKQNKQNNK